MLGIFECFHNQTVYCPQYLCPTRKTLTKQNLATDTVGCLWLKRNHLEYWLQHCPAGLLHLYNISGDTYSGHIQILNNNITIFCTITAINITKYNNFLNNTRKTSILKHEHWYPDIETQIDTVIEAINNIVYKKYIFTAWLTQTIRCRHEKGARAWEILHDILHDNNHQHHQI